MRDNRAMLSTINNLVTTAEELGITLPTKAAEVAADARAQVAKFQKMIAATDENFIHAAAAAVEADKDPTTDKTVTRAFIAVELKRKQHGIEEALYGKIKATISKDIDDIIAAFKPVYEEAGSKYATARQEIIAQGFSGVGDNRIVNANLTTATSNVEGRNALHTVKTIRQAIGLLLIEHPGYNPRSRAQTFMHFDVGDTRISEIPNPITDDQAMSLGFTHSLATPSEARARQEHATRMQEDHEQRAAETHRRRREWSSR